MKIEYWSDFNCPYSYIGNIRLKKAIDELKLDVKWKMKSFELEPHIKSPVSARDYLIRKNNISTNEAESRIEEVNEIAKQEGLDFDYANTPVTSTRDAHRLVKYAQLKKPEITDNLIMELFKSHFIENKDISDYTVLFEISEKVNLENSLEVLESGRYHPEVEIDEEDAYLLNIKYTPVYFLKNNNKKLIIPGTLTKEEFKISINDLLNDNLEIKSHGFGIL